MAAAFYMDSIGMDAIKNFKKHMRSKQALWLGIMMLLLFLNYLIVQRHTAKKSNDYFLLRFEINT